MSGGGSEYGPSNTTYHGGHPCGVSNDHQDWDLAERCTRQDLDKAKEESMKKGRNQSTILVGIVLIGFIGINKAIFQAQEQAHEEEARRDSCDKSDTQTVSLEQRNRIVRNLGQAETRYKELELEAPLPKPHELVCVKDKDGEISFHIREHAELIIEELKLDEE